MKLLFLLLFFLSFTANAQEEEKEVPPVGTKVVPAAPEKQEASPNQIENPFAIGPYQNGEYQYTNPDRDPDAQGTEDNPM